MFYEFATLLLFSLQYLTARGFLQTHAAFHTESQLRAKEATPTLSSDLHVGNRALTGQPHSFLQFYGLPI